MSSKEEVSEVVAENNDVVEKAAGDATELKGVKRSAEVAEEDTKKLKKDHAGDKENGDEPVVEDDVDDEDDEDENGDDYDDEAEGELDDEEDIEGEDGEDDDDDEEDS